MKQEQAVKAPRQPKYAFRNPDSYYKKTTSPVVLVGAFFLPIIFDTVYSKLDNIVTTGSHR